MEAMQEQKEKQANFGSNNSSEEQVRNPVIGIVVGEASGDLIGGYLLEHIKLDFPELKSMGIGGPLMVKRGFIAWWPCKMLSLMGFGWDVISQLRALFAVRKVLQKRLTDEGVQLFIGIDAPDFNLTLEKRLRSDGVKTIHYVCPSVWAWREYRVKKLKQAVDHVLCVFPFEPEYLKQYGIEATFIGHPLARVIPMEPDKIKARHQLGLMDQGRVLAVLPGSRGAEVKMLTHIFLQSAQTLLSQCVDLQVVVPCVPWLREQIVAVVDRMNFSDKQKVRLHLIEGNSHVALEACDLVLVASGTATLEAMLYKRPMVVAYQLNSFSTFLYKIWRNKATPWVSLPNILLQRYAVPELLQRQVNAKTITRELLSWLEEVKTHGEKLKELEADFYQMHVLLRRDTPTEAAHVIKKFL